MRRGEIAQALTRGVFYLTIEKGAALVSGVAYFALLLRWLGPTKYGIMTLALSFIGLATTFNGNFEVFLERYAAEYLATGRLRTLRSAHLQALGLKLALGLVAGLVIWLAAPFVARLYATPELAMLMPLLSIMVILDGAATTGRATLYGLQRFRWLSAVALSFHVVKTVMVGLLWWFRQGLPALAIGLSTLAVAQGLANTALPLWMLRHARDPEGEPAGQTARGLRRSIVSYCVPLLGARVTFLSGQNLSKIVLGKMFTATDLGYFSFAYQTVERFVEVIYALPSSLLPTFTQLVARRERERLVFVFDQSLRLIQLVALVMSCGLVVFAPEVTRVVGSRLFTPSVPLLRIMALVPIVRTAQQPLTMLFQALRRPGTVLGLALLKFAGEFGCYFALVPSLGMAGAGWANLVGAVASYAAALLIVNRAVPEGVAERTVVAARGLLAFLPLTALGVFLDSRLAHLPSLLLRVAMVPVALVMIFSLGLVRHDDFDRLMSFPLEVAWMRRTRDGVMAGVQRVAEALTPRRLL
jgi:PST family polysaccharide transporter